MNGVHDMGGMHGMGPIVAEPSEPVFHARWEGRLFALRRAVGAWRRWNIDAMRHAVERVPPVPHLAASYYARQYLGFVTILVERGLLTQSEIDTGQAAPGQARLVPPLTADRVAAMVAHGAPARRDVSTAPGFAIGQSVRARELHPAGHTRLPRYARGRTGTVVRDHGVYVLPDTNAHFLGEQPQHLYQVRFTATELWGDSASPTDAVYLDLWELYLEPTE
jgi:nitrile hydratase